MFAFVRKNSLLTIALLIFSCAGCAPQTVDATPSQTLKNFVAAAQKKDAAAMKSHLSGGTLKLMEDRARAQNKTLEQMLADNTNESLAAKAAESETRNEQINGDTATLEVKNPQTGGWDKLYFAKENNDWKIALDKMMQEMLKDTGDAAN